MSRDWPFEHHDGAGDTLRIAPSADFRSCALVRTEGGATRVRAKDLPDVIAALYEAAGLPAPIILPRPWLPEGFDPVEDISYRVARTEFDGSHGVQLTADDDLTRTQALELAAYLAAFAGPEPDPPEVEALAAEMRDADPDGYRAYARFLVQAGWPSHG